MIRKKAAALPMSTLARLEAWRAAGRPIRIVINGQIELTIDDDGSFQELLTLVDRLETIEGIKRGLESFERGEGRPAREALEELRRKHKHSRRRT